MFKGIRRKRMSVLGTPIIIAFVACAGFIWLSRSSDGSDDPESLDRSGSSGALPQQIVQDQKMEVNEEEPDPSPDANARATNDDMGNIGEELSVQGVQISILEGLYGEETHEIQELPPPDGPVALRVKHTRDDKGTTYQKRAVYIQEFPFGMKTGRLMSETVRIEDVDTVDNTAKIRLSMRTLSSCAEGLPHPAWDFGALDFDKTCTLSGDNRRNDLQSEWKSENLDFYRLVSDHDQALVFPQGKMELGKKYTIDAPSLVQDLPDTWAAEPGKVDLTLSRRVLFDGQEAYEVNFEHVGYAGIELSLPVEPIKAKMRGGGKYYVDAGTGRVLWGQMRYQFADCTVALIKGLSLHIRSELVSASSQ